MQKKRKAVHRIRKHAGPFYSLRIPRLPSEELWVRIRRLISVESKIKERSTDLFDYVIFRPQTDRRSVVKYEMAIERKPKTRFLKFATNRMSVTDDDASTCNKMAEFTD